MIKCSECKHVVNNKEYEIPIECKLANGSNSKASMLRIAVFNDCCPFFEELLINDGWGAK